jgi:membrane protease YdiL (CAAX protease family)
MAGEDVNAGNDVGAALQEVGRRLRWGALATLLAGAGALFGLNLRALDALALAGFGVAMPGLAWAQLPLLQGLRVDRMTVYLSSGRTLLILGIVALLVANRGVGLEALRLLPLDLARGVVWTLGLLIALVLMVVVFAPLERRRTVGQETFLAQLIPQTPEEKVTFVGLSLAAGMAEELIYRGYVPAVLIGAGLDPGWAFGVSCAGFGLLHAYQGGLGIVRTGAVGGVLSLAVVASGSLFPAMAAHALFDILSGDYLGRVRPSDDRPGPG